MNRESLNAERLCQTFQFLKHEGKEIIDRLISSAVLKTLPKGEFVLLEGDECSHFALIISGVVRVYKLGETGREITLYRISEGESCVLTASCILSQREFPAHAIVEKDVEAAIIPSTLVREWVHRYEGWRTYIFNLLSKRFSEVLETIEEVAFRRLDIRIAEMLVGLVQNNELNILITHQDMALELGTSREVVSRILKHFEGEDFISLKRKEIVINNLDALIKKSQG